MAHNKDSVLIGLKKATSLLQKVQKMVEEDKYCIDVIQQVLAAIGLMRSVNTKLLEGHLGNCFKKAMQASNSKRQDEVIEELIAIVNIAQKK